MIPDMKHLMAALAVGLAVGLIYALVGVKSPAPPIVALVGLLGILLGEQLPRLARQPSPAGPLGAPDGTGPAATSGPTAEPKRWPNPPIP